MTTRPWREAWQEALYGPEGFWLRQVPGEHFRTSVASPPFARAVRRLAGLVDDAVGRPDPFDVVDVGAGRGELLSALAALPDVPARWRLTGVEVADADVAFAWRRDVPELTGLLLAHEWLDDLPLEVLFDGRVVEVGPDGVEALGAPGTDDDLAWRDRWWPAGRRVEVGRSRDLAWSSAVAKVRRGLAVAVDYGHALGDVTTYGDRRPTLTGHRDGRQVPPLPDGSCDLTAHVALDALAHAVSGRVLSQRTALAALGVDATLPPRAMSRTEPRRYLAELAAATQAAELLDPRGLGAFGWVVREVGTSPVLP